MLTQTISPIFGREEQEMLRTQVGGSGNGNIITVAASISRPDDDEPRAAVVEAEAYLLRQRITHLLANVTNLRHEMNLRPSLREQRAHAIPDFDIFEEGGAM